MAVDGYTKGKFGEELGRILSASRLIQSIEHLKGREKELDTIDKSLYAPGRHVFVYGDRGVGKCSGQVMSDTTIGFFAALFRSKTEGDRLPNTECMRLQL